MLECLTNVVGVTQSNCQCIIQGLPPEKVTALHTSTSNIFMDDVPGSPNIGRITDVGNCKTFADWAIDSIPAAIKILEADALVSITGPGRRTKSEYRGAIGQPSYAATLPVTKAYQFMKLTPDGPTDGVIQINGIRAFINGAGTFPFYIISRRLNIDEYTTVYTGNLVAPNPGYGTVQGEAFPLLPLTDNGSIIEYYFIWDRNVSGVSPYDNSLYCNCSSQSGGVLDYLIMNGGEADTLNFLGKEKTDRKSHGLILDVALTCDTTRFVCRQYQQNKGIAAILAWMVAFKANQILVQKILDSNEINRYTMMSREALYGKMSNFKAEYNTRMEYLAQVIDITDTDCFLCKDAQMIKTIILK
jgi:hypothetical protein